MRFLKNMKRKHPFEPKCFKLFRHQMVWSRKHSGKRCGFGNGTGHGQVLSDTRHVSGYHRRTRHQIRSRKPVFLYAVREKDTGGKASKSGIFRLVCECDEAFYRCLKSVNTKTSTQIGHIYFTGLGTQCYKQEYPISGCNKYTTFP